MISRISPKESFLSDKTRADRHNETVLNPSFRVACETAFASYLIKQSGSDPRVAPILEGARGVLDELLNLGLPSVPLAPQESKSLRAV